MGGNRYGWFTNIDVTGGIAVDTFTLGDFEGKVAENLNVSGSGSVHTETGVLPFIDVDLTDTHGTPTVTPQGGGYLGTFVANLINDSTGDGEGVVTWSFSVADSALDFLAADETIHQRYDVTVSDGNGGVRTQTVTVTLTGANDAPTTSALTAAAIADRQRCAPDHAGRASGQCGRR